MMISPERYRDLHIDKTYSELLAVRDELLESIRAFENHTYDPKLDWIMPSPDTVYQCNLEYLGKRKKSSKKASGSDIDWGKGVYVRCTVTCDVKTFTLFTSGMKSSAIVMMVEEGAEDLFDISDYLI